MAASPRRFPIYLEVGGKRVFAASVDWPPWARSGRDEEAAIENLFAYAHRFAEVVRQTRLGFRPPSDAGAFSLVERLPGTATTDFGAPDVAPSIDREPLRAADLRRSETILRACWRAFDRAIAAAAEGGELTKGPRGGGRDLERIVDHVLGSDEGYLRMIGGKPPGDDDPGDRADRVRRVIVSSLGRVARDGVPPSPRGGKRWTPRYFVRRSSWHVLDHAWELEDRTPTR